jgi:hypothetical protein
MPHYRARFATSALAQAAAVATVEYIKTTWLSVAQSALPAADLATAAAAPTVRRTILGVDEVTAGSLPSTAAGTSIVRERVTSIDGRSQIVYQAQPTAQIPTPDKAAGFTRVDVTAGSGTYAQVKCTAVGAGAVRFVGTVASTAIASGTKLRDPVSGKRYATTGLATIPATAPFEIGANVAETDVTEVGDLDVGSTMVLVSPIVGVLSSCQVTRLANLSIVAGTALTAADGRLYSVATTTTTSAYEKTVTVPVIADVASYRDAISAAVGDELTFTVRQANTSTLATVMRAASVTIPAGSVLTSTTSKSYTTPADAVIGDSLVNDIAFSASAAGPASNVAIFDVLTFSAPPSNVTAATSVQSISQSSNYPVAEPTEILGEPPDWDYTIDRGTDGLYNLVVFTVPFGS